MNLPRAVEGFDDNYVIYEDGSVFNKKSNRFIKSTLAKRKDRSIDKCYYVVSLSNNDKRYSKKIHRLIAEAFIPNPENLPYVDHIDRNSQNNDIENLRWVDNSTNQLNSGAKKTNKLGEKHINKTKHNTYRFCIIKDNKSVIYKTFKTLEDAKEYRNDFIKENPIYSL